MRLTTQLLMIPILFEFDLNLLYFILLYLYYTLLSFTLLYFISRFERLLPLLSLLYHTFFFTSSFQAMLL